jgi:hypothetical protein
VATEARAAGRAEPIDEFLHSWVRWREASESVESAYRYWATCDRDRRGLAFDLYVAALDREEHAARIHQRRSTALAEPSATTRAS